MSKKETVKCRINIGTLQYGDGIYEQGDIAELPREKAKMLGWEVTILDGTQPKEEPKKIIGKTNIEKILADKPSAKDVSYLANKYKREELNKMAKEKGITDPEMMRNEREVSRAILEA